MSIEQYLVPIDHSHSHKDHRANICFGCAYPIAKCPWLRADKPVPGWTAKKSIVRFTRTKNGRAERYSQETYHITACPLFKDYPPERRKKQDGTDRGCNTLRTFYE